MRSEETMLQPGSKLRDRYEMISEIAHGASKQTWRAFDQVIKRNVAIKVLLRNDEGVGRLIEEARTQAKLPPVYMPIVYDAEYDEQEKVYFIAEELIVGKPLRDILQQKVPKDWVSPDEAKRIFRQCLEALQAAHQRNYVHGDIKPANIMLRSVGDVLGEVVLIDWGEARYLDRKERWGQKAPEMWGGSKSSAAPEVLRNPEDPAYPDFQSDLFSLGVLGYLLFTGRHPFFHPSGLWSPESMILNDSYDVPPLLMSVIGSKVPEKVASVIMRLLERKRDPIADDKERDNYRYKSAKQALSDLLESEFVECPECRQKNPGANKFCSNCGGNLEAIPTFNRSSYAFDYAKKLDSEGRTKQAIEALEKHLPLLEKENNAWAVEFLGFLCNSPRIADYKNGEKYASMAIRMAASKPELSGPLVRAYYVRATSKRRDASLGDPVPDYNKAIEMEWDGRRTSEYLTARAEVYLEREDNESALNDLDQACKLDEQNERARILLETRFKAKPA